MRRGTAAAEPIPVYLAQPTGVFSLVRGTLGCKACQQSRRGPRGRRHGSKDGSQLPGGKLLVPKAELFALGLLPRRYGQDELEDLLADLLHRLLPV
jgi:hypothetical protein